MPLLHKRTGEEGVQQPPLRISPASINERRSAAEELTEEGRKVGSDMVLDESHES